LYERRVSDVRFLVPVLAGLSKREIIEALPKLIKMNLNVVKEVLINRLLSGKNIETHAPPLKPHELLIALHEMESQLADMKSIVAACNILLARKDLYTQEILAGVIQQLSDQPTIPALLMRTMLQALNTYPKLLGFLMNVMDRLVVKQIWRQSAKVWEGFVKICERTMPQSYTILLHLPEAQLRNAFILAPTMREPLLKYVNSLTIQQQATIPPKVIDVIQTDPAKYAERFLKGDDAGSRSGSEEREVEVGAGENMES